MQRLSLRYHFGPKVAKCFSYARSPDKAALFVGAFERFIEEQIGILRIFEPMPENVEAGLCALGRRLLGLALRPEVFAFHHLFIAEEPRFPGLASSLSSAIVIAPLAKLSMS